VDHTATLLMRAGTNPALFDRMEIVVARLDLEPAAVRTSASLLSDAERKRATRFAFGRDARRFIVARAQLRQMLGARLGMRPESVQLAYGARGKPALANAARHPLRFNLAHCDDLAVYALSSGCEVGIDVEAIRPLPDADDLAARFFSRREQADYRALRRRDRPLGFFQCWTRKEAFVKALGDGLSHPLDSFDVSLAPGVPAELLRVEPGLGVDRSWRLTSFSPAPGFVAAVAVEVC
jgi:4'-phosphopantetheinyl transferase